MIRIFIGALLGALILFFWGFIYWALSPLPFQVIGAMPAKSGLPAQVKEIFKEDGVYLYPWPEHEDGQNEATSEEEVMRRHREGPIIQLTYIRNGVDPMSPITMILGFIHFYICAFLAGILLYMALPGLPSYAARVFFVFALGTFAAVTVHLATPIWWHHPWLFPLFSAAFVAGGWLLAGLVMALVIKPKAIA